MNNDNIKGTAKKIEGSVESAFGRATGDASIEAKGEANQVKGKILNAFGKVEDAVSTLASSAADEARHLQSQVVEKPVQSAVIALVAGLLIGRFLR